MEVGEVEHERRIEIRGFSSIFLVLLAKGFFFSDLIFFPSFYVFLELMFM